MLPIEISVAKIKGRYMDMNIFGTWATDEIIGLIIGLIAMFGCMFTCGKEEKEEL